MIGLVSAPAQDSTLVVAANDNLGSPTGTIVLDLGSTLAFADSFEVTRSIRLDGTAPSAIDTQDNIVTASGVVSGLAPLVKDGIGTLILTNSNSQVGGAVINQGTLQIGGGAGTGTLNGNVSIAANARLVFDRTNAASFGGISGRGGASTFGGIISGEGEVVQTGLRHAHRARCPYLYGRDQRRRRAAAGQRIDRADRRRSPAARELGGTGSIGGAVTIADGGSLAPGASVGTLTVGSLLLNPGSLLDYELGLPDIVGGTTNDLIIVTGGLTLDGTLYIADAGGFSRGVYRLINYGGTLTDNGLVLGSLPTRFAASDMLISTVTPGEVNLIVSTGGFGLQFWDGANTVANGAVEGGTGTWVNNATNWTAPDGSVNAPWQGGFAVFQGTAGTVTLGENIAFEGMQFLSTGYVIDGGGFGLAAAPDTVVRVDPAVTATINAPIADGTGGAARAHQVGRRAPHPRREQQLQRRHAGQRRHPPDRRRRQSRGGRAAGSPWMRARWRRPPASPRRATSRSARMAAPSRPAPAPSSRLAARSTGRAALGKTGAGTLILTGTNSYAGGTFLGAGVLAVSSDANLGFVGTTTLDFDGGTLRLDASFDPAAGRAVTLGSLGGTIDTNGNDSTFGQVISGSGTLTKAGTGTLTLTGANSYSGDTTISAGTLQIGNGGITGSLIGDIANEGALVFDRSDADHLCRRDQRCRSRSSRSAAAR